MRSNAAPADTVSVAELVAEWFVLTELVLILVAESV